MSELNIKEIKTLDYKKPQIEQKIRILEIPDLPENSYTAKLFSKGVNKIAQKVGEEAVELIIESKDSDDERFLNEAADLLFHTMMLLVDRGYGLEDVVKVLKGRH